MHSFALVVPVKSLSAAKSRLGDSSARPSLALAFALDALTAASTAALVSRLVVVSDEPSLREPLAALGALRVPDEGGGDLNEAILGGVRRCPAGPVAAMCADLPALTSTDLDEALTQALRSFSDHRMALVADTQGTGTTLLAAADPSALEPHFGPGSRAAHRAAGAVEIGLPVPTLRADVDSPSDLDAATALGLGRHTADTVAQWD